MLKEEDSLFSKILIIVAIIFLVNLTFLIFRYKPITAGTTGFLVKDDVYNFYESLPSASKTFLLIQASLLICLLIYVNVKDRLVIDKQNKPESLSIGEIIPQSKTDLDAFYVLLQDKKELVISTISKTFKITPELAMEWGKILESGNLATIQYPRIGEPAVRIIQNKEN